MKIKRLLWIILGFIGLGIGAVGVVLPMLPAFPFLLLAAFSFGKSSERLHKWFIGTKLYKNNLCKRSRYDFVHQNQGYGYSNASDGVWLLYDVPQGSVYPLCHSRRRVAVPYRIFHLGRKNIRRVLILRMRT